MLVPSKAPAAPVGRRMQAQTSHHRPSGLPTCTALPPAVPGETMCPLSSTWWRTWSKGVRQDHPSQAVKHPSPPAALSLQSPRPRRAQPAPPPNSWEACRQFPRPCPQTPGPHQSPTATHSPWSRRATRHPRSLWCESRGLLHHQASRPAPRRPYVLCLSSRPVVVAALAGPCCSKLVRPFFSLHSGWRRLGQAVRPLNS